MVRRLFVPIALLASVLAGCTQFRPVDQDPGQSWVSAKREAYVAPAFSGKLHKVARGDTASTIAVRYGVTLQQLAQANDMANPYVVRLGRNLKIPGAIEQPVRTRAPEIQHTPEPASPMAPQPVQSDIKVATLASIVPTPEVAPAQLRAAVEAVAPAAEPAAEMVPVTLPAVNPGDMARASAKKPPGLSGDGFLWPTSGSIVSRYGAKKDGSQNDGINIAARLGSPVLAAENGVVSYASDEIEGWGRMVLIRHADGFTTGYAHLESILTHVGDDVHRGQVIGRVGQTGYVDTPQLHFELRSGKRALNPAKLLTKDETLRVASR